MLSKLGGGESIKHENEEHNLISREKCRDFSGVIFFSARLKRTTDMMFGGKQVVVCGYGEVRLTLSVIRCLNYILLK